MNIYPNKLKAGDQIRVISPATSLKRLDAQQIAEATAVLSQLGLVVSFSNNAYSCDKYMSSSIKERVEDIHEAFGDSKVSAIITTLGGLNSIQLLSKIDYKLIQANPKIFCGFSDITALQLAFLKKASLVTYSGPHFATFSRKNTLEFTCDYFKRCLFNKAQFEIEAGSYYTRDSWDIIPENTNRIIETQLIGLNSGIAHGNIIGGNLSTLSLIIGTEYEPSYQDVILFIEDDCDVTPLHFDRFLQGLILSSFFSSVRGIVIGRFEEESGITIDTLVDIVSWHSELRTIPIVANAPFGHTSPMITFPIGGTADLKITSSNKVSLQITEH
jgi:muramoyltetrapeptide carboxypeptidase